MNRFYWLAVDSESRATILTATWVFLFDQLRSSMPYFALDADERADLLWIRHAAIDGAEEIELEAVQWMALSTLLDRWMMLDDRLTNQERAFANALSAEIDEMLNGEPDFELPWAEPVEEIVVPAFGRPQQKLMEWI